jgi:hypothetical protein
MATSVYFNNFQSSQEQILIENLVIESIKVYGHDVYYMPRLLNNKDEIYGEATSARYDNAFFVDMYIKNVQGFKGQGDFLSKFGLQIRDEITFCIARRTFSEEIGMYDDLVRPREGDLIYLPLNKKIFQVKFVEHEAIFYQMGALQMYELQCELFEYSGESFDTGIPEIDNLMNGYNPDMASEELLLENGLVLLDEDGFPLVNEAFALDPSTSDNTDFALEAEDVIDWTELDPFSEGRY